MTTDDFISPKHPTAGLFRFGLAHFGEPWSMYLGHRKLNSGDCLKHQSYHLTPRSRSLL
jgi:hypothetical protein